MKGCLGGDCRINMLAYADFKGKKKQQEYVYYSIVKDDRFIAFFNAKLYPRSKKIEMLYYYSDRFEAMLNSLKSSPDMHIAEAVEAGEIDFVIESFKPPKEK